MLELSRDCDTSQVQSTIWRPDFIPEATEIVRSQVEQAQPGDK